MASWDEMDKDCLTLRRLFFLAYDESFFVKALQNIVKNDLSLVEQFLGQGTHFKAFRLKKRWPKPDISYVVSCDQSSPQEWVLRQAWFHALERLGKLALPLIPPFKIIRHEGHYAIVMPYGLKDMSPIHEVWQPLADAVTLLQREMAKNGFWIRDSLQCVQLHGIPFVYDLSDLDYLQASPSAAFSTRQKKSEID